MAHKSPAFDPDNPEHARKRAEARERLDAIDPAKQPGGALADPKRRDWFEAVYTLSGGDPAAVPWGNMAAHPHLLDWLAGEPGLDGLTALDVGCGLGDNAAALAAAGATVTAFDLVPRAAEWAAGRFAESGVAFCAGDLFAPPREWLGAFDLVHETYTLQALPSRILPAARKALADLVRPGGRLLVIARARDEGQGIEGPPWPLARSDIEAFAENGLVLERLDDLAPGATPSRHWRAILRRPA